MQLNLIRAVVLYLGTVALGAFCRAQPEQAGRNGGHRWEMTQADVFSRNNWNSAQIQIWGIYLGMSRIEASAAAEGRGLRLAQNQYQPTPCGTAEECSVYDSRGNYAAYVLRFGKLDRVIEMAIYRVPEYAEAAVKKAAVTRQFKGQTFQFFNTDYSDQLRLKLFGADAMKEFVSGGFGDKVKDTKYVYLRKGIAVITSPRGLLDSRAELVQVSFCTINDQGESPAR
jgi:hypothetical protein